MTREKILQQYCKDEVVSPEVAPVAGESPEIEYIIPEAQDQATEEKYVYQGLIHSDVEDPLRKGTGYHWIYTGNENEIETQKLNLRKPRNEQKILNINEYSVVPETGDVKQSIFFDYKDTVEERTSNMASQVVIPTGLDLEQDIIPTKFRNTLNEIDEAIGTDFFYLVLSNNRPVRKLIDSSEKQEFYITTRNEYRDYNRKYEDTNRIVSTTTLPNYYILNEDNFYRSGETGEYLNKDIANYNDTITPSRYSFIDEFSSIPFDPQVQSRISKKLENVLFPWDKMDLYEDYNQSSFKEFYPYNLMLQFTTEKIKTISNLLKQNDLNDLLLVNIFSKQKEEQIEKKLFSIQGNNELLRKREQVSVLEINESLLVDLTNPLKEQDDLCLLDAIEDENQISVDNFLLDHEDFKKDKILTFRDMINGKSCYSETLFYEINKYEISGEEFQKIQTFYVSNTDEIDKISIVDTQVKYGKKYRYEVFAYKYALANKYRYESSEKQYSYEVFITPTPVIVKMLFSTIEEVVLDKPPAQPEVDIIPYKDNSENISFFFNPSTLKYKLKEFAFTEGERQMYSMIRDSQNLSDDEYITFDGDDTIDRYYIYRTDVYPYSYEDFKEKLYNVVYTEENCVTAEYLDRLESNKKYYYIFRSVDVHGHISPPTDVREIELINEGGTTFLHSMVVPFKENKFKKEEKNVKKYIHIKPSLIQSLIDESTLQAEEGQGAKDILEGVKLGSGELIEESVWSKRFKMRIKSKSTNKFIDIKFRFMKENKRNSE